MQCGTLRHLCWQDAGIDVDDEPGSTIFRADVGMKADRMLSRPIEQRVAIRDANPGIFTGSTCMSAIDDPLGWGEPLLDGDLTALQEGEHAIRDLRVIVEVPSRHDRPAAVASSSLLRPSHGGFEVRTLAAADRRARLSAPSHDRQGRSPCQTCRDEIR